MSLIQEQRTIKKVRVEMWLAGACLFLLNILPNTAIATCTGIGCNCTVNASNIAFGTLMISSNPVNSSGTISVSCSATVAGLISYDLEISAGSGSFSQRTMSNGTSTMNYNLYTNASYTTVWGDGTAGSSKVFGVSLPIGLTPSFTPYTIYAQIAGGQTSLTGGSYLDSGLTVTVTY